MTSEKFGEKQVFEWRRSHGARAPAGVSRPPPSCFHPRYAELTPQELPAAGTPRQTAARVMPDRHEGLAPTDKIEAGGAPGGLVPRQLAACLERPDGIS